MSPMAGPEEVVNPPTLAPEPVGLLRTLQVLDMDDRGIGGVRHRPENVAPLLGLDPCANTVVTPVFTGAPSRVGRSFVAQQIDECGSWGWEEDEYEERATRGLLAKESIFVEAELERAVTVPENPHLSQPGTVTTGATLSWANGGNIITDSANGFRQYMEGYRITATAAWPADTPPTQLLAILDDGHAEVSESAAAAGAAQALTFTDPAFVACAAGTAVSPALAMAYLNQAIADAGIGMGVIHVPAFVGERMLASRTLAHGASPNGIYYSVNGNPIVVGNGYTGVGPDGSGGSPTTVAPAGTVYQWAYATDLMQVYRAADPMLYPPTLAQALDRQLNLVAYRATRPYAVNWSVLLRAACKIAVTSGEPT